MSGTGSKFRKSPLGNTGVAAIISPIVLSNTSISTRDAILISETLVSGTCTLQLYVVRTTPHLLHARWQSRDDSWRR